MKTPIQENQALSYIEKNIIDELPGKELWGDLLLSRAEYDCLKLKIKTLLEHDAVDIGYICTFFPCSLTTFMVFLIRYEFNVNFWGLLSQELNIDMNGPTESIIGKCARKTFQKYGFDFSDVSEERRVNLEPIIYEAGRPPQSCLDDLFYLLKYDAYSVFDPQLLIEDMIEMRSYQIRKPMLRFLKRFKEDRAIEFVLEVHDAMLAVDQNMSTESRYIGNYVSWKEQEKSKEAATNRKKQEFQTKPYLFFENGKRGLCIVLPRTIMKDEWIEDVEWIIQGDREKRICKRMNVYGDEGRRFVESCVVPVSPAKKYSISLVDYESFETASIIEWSIDGISDEKASFFNSSGRSISPNYLQVPYGIMIFSDSLKLLEKNHLAISNQSYPTNREGYTVVSIEPTGKDAKLSYTANGTIVTLLTRPQISMDFSGKRLFSLAESNLFVDLPELIISIDEGTITNGYQLRFGQEKLDISNSFQGGKTCVDLSRYKDTCFVKYGTYGIRLYQHDHFIKQIELCYVPDIKTNYVPKMCWPDRFVRSMRKKLYFERIDDWSMEFPECKVSNDEARYMVECPANRGVIFCKLKSMAEDEGFSCSFELPVNPFEVEILDSQEMTLEESTSKLAKVGLSDILSNSYWARLSVFGEYKDYLYSLKLHSANGIEQEENITLSQMGCVNFNLRAFFDTLNSCPLPTQIELWCDHDESKTVPILIVTDNIELKRRPVYSANGFMILSLEDDNKDISIRRFGKERMEITIPYSESRMNKSKTKRGYLCRPRLKEGIYAVEENCKNNGFIFEDSQNMELSNGNNTIYVSFRDSQNPIVSVSDWLDQLLKDVVKAGINKDFSTLLSYRIQNRVDNLSKTELSLFDYERMVALAFFMNSKCVDSKKEAIRQCMKTISRTILDAGSRLEIIRFLADIGCPQEIFDICLKEYDLLLFERGSEDSKILAEKIENNSTELSMLLLMGSNDTVWNTIRRDKYRELIGIEAIKCMLSVPGEENREKISLEQKKFLRESSPCRVKIILTSEISGDMEPIQEMLEVTYNSIKFNIDKKPDFGIYFDRIRYVDQYVNWYTKNHDNKGEMLPWKREMMKTSVRAECRNIVESISKLTRIEGFGKRVKHYQDVLQNRFKGNPFENLNANNYQRYFYLQGLAAFLVLIPDTYHISEDMKSAAERFMLDAAVVSPRIARRDVIMASTYLYLIQKEDKICQ